MEADNQGTLRHQIEQWVADEMNDHEEVDIRVIATRGYEHFCADTEFRSLFVHEFLRSTIYTIGLSLMTRARHMTLSAEQAADLIAEGRAGKIAKWRERDPRSGTYILLTKLEKSQALRAAEDREKRGSPNLKRAGFLRLVAGRLEEGECVEEKWTLQQLAQLEEQVEVAAPKYTLKNQRTRSSRTPTMARLRSEEGVIA